MAVTSAEELQRLMVADAIGRPLELTAPRPDAQVDVIAVALNFLERSLSRWSE